MAKNATTTNTTKANVIATLMKELNAEEIAALAKLGSGASTDEVFAACPTLAAKLMKNPEIIKGLAGEAAEAEAGEDDGDDTSLQLAILKKENARLRKQAAKKSSKKSKKDEDDEDDDDDDEDEDDDALFKVKIADDWSWNRVGEIVLGGAIVSALTIGAVYAINALSEK